MLVAGVAGQNDAAARRRRRQFGAGGEVDLGVHEDDMEASFDRVFA